MKFFAMITLALSTLVSSAHAQNTETTTLKIIGRGIENRQTNELIALSCTDERCKDVQAVIFNADRTQVTSFGAIMHVTDKETASKKEIRRFLKNLDHKKRDARMEMMSPEKKKLLHLMYFATTGGFFLKSMQVAVVTGTLSFATSLIIPAATVGVSYLVVGLVNRALRGNSSSEALLDQDGWNWSVRPRVVSSKNFQAYIDALTSGV